MRRALAFAALLAMTAVGSASATTWASYADIGGGRQWFYDTDYSYKDKASGRVVVMQAIGVPEKKVGPNGPGAADGGGSLVALDCKAKNQISIASYAPSKPLVELAGWTTATPKKISLDEDRKLLAAACANVDSLPVK